MNSIVCLQKGFKAPQAAGRIHTDFEKGFIMAEVMKFEDFKEEGSEAACKVNKVHLRNAMSMCICTMHFIESEANAQLFQGFCVKNVSLSNFFFRLQESIDNKEEITWSKMVTSYFSSSMLERD